MGSLEEDPSSRARASRPVSQAVGGRALAFRPGAIDSDTLTDTGCDQQPRVAGGLVVLRGSHYELARAES